MIFLKLNFILFYIRFKTFIDSLLHKETKHLSMAQTVLHHQVSLFLSFSLVLKVTVTLDPTISL